MSIVSEQQMQSEHDQDTIDFFKRLKDRDELKGVVEGVAKQAIGKGLNSLSAKQETVLESFINDYSKKNECERCVNGNVSSLTDHIEIADNGLCPMCEYDREKFMAE